MGNNCDLLIKMDILNPALNIYTPVLGVGRPAGNCSCPESTRCFDQCLIPFGGCRFGFCSCRVVSTLATAVGAELLLRFWGPRSKLISSSWSNTFIMGIYPNVSARIYIVMSHPYKLISTFFRLAALESGQSNDRLPQCLLILINSLRSNGAHMCQ